MRRTMDQVCAGARTLASPANPALLSSSKGKPAAMREVASNPAAFNDAKSNPAAFKDAKSNPAALSDAASNPAAFKDAKSNPAAFSRLQNSSCVSFNGNCAHPVQGQNAAAQMQVCDNSNEAAACIGCWTNARVTCCATAASLVPADDRGAIWKQ